MLSINSFVGLAPLINRLLPSPSTSSDSNGNCMFVLLAKSNVSNITLFTLSFIANLELSLNPSASSSMTNAEYHINGIDKIITNNFVNMILPLPIAPLLSAVSLFLQTRKPMTEKLIIKNTIIQRFLNAFRKLKSKPIIDNMLLIESFNQPTAFDVTVLSVSAISLAKPNIAIGLNV